MYFINRILRSLGTISRTQQSQLSLLKKFLKNCFELSKLVLWYRQNTKNRQFRLCDRQRIILGQESQAHTHFSTSTSCREKKQNKTKMSSLLNMVFCNLALTF